MVRRIVGSFLNRMKHFFCCNFFCGYFYIQPFVLNRYPDFLTQMQAYTDDSYTLCSIVGGGGGIMAKTTFNG